MLEAIADVIDSLTSGSSDEAKSEGGKKKPEGRWALITGVLTFVLYVFGYLTLRFHLNAFGVDTDLSVLDERYLFAGAQFLVYFATSLPIAIPCFLLGALALRKLGVERWPNRALGVGIALSIILIQLFTRDCLAFTNLLLRGGLPKPQWMQAVLLDDNGAIQFLYFTGLVVAVGLFTSLLWQATRAAGRFDRVLAAALALLIAIQFLMLPVTFGVLIADSSVARVTTLDGKEKIKPNEQAWRIWEGKDGTTFFVVEWEGKERRSMTLISLDNKKIEATKIAGYDRILKLLN